MRALSTKSGTPSSAAACITASTMPRRLGQRPHLVLDVAADHAQADRPADGLGGVAVPRLEVGGHRQVDRVDDPADGLEHQVARDVLAVLVAVHRRDRMAGGGDRAGALGLRRRRGRWRRPRRSPG